MQLMTTEQNNVWDNKEYLQEVRNLFAKNLTDVEFDLMVSIGKSTGLDARRKEIFAVKFGNNPAQIIIGRDGYRKASQRHPEYEPSFVDTLYSNDDFCIENFIPKHTYGKPKRGELVGAFFVGFRKSCARPIYHYVDLIEYNSGSNPLWKIKPVTMIKKVAESQGLRMCYQDMFSGTYDDSELWEDRQKSSDMKVVTPYPDQINKKQIQSVDAKKDVLDLIEALKSDIKNSNDLQSLKSFFGSAWNQCRKLPESDCSEIQIEIQSEYEKRKRFLETDVEVME